MANCKRCGTELPINKVGDFCGSPSPCAILNCLLVQETAEVEPEVTHESKMTEEELLRSIEEHNNAI